jgi:hypothetical protein
VKVGLLKGAFEEENGKSIEISEFGNGDFCGHRKMLWPSPCITGMRPALKKDRMRKAKKKTDQYPGHGFPKRLSQDKWRNVMKNIRYLVLAAVAVLFATAAQAQEFGVKATIPFAFVANNHTYPAGSYVLSNLKQSSDLLLMRGTGEIKSTVALMPHQCVSMKTAEGSKLIFHRVGNTYFLYQVWSQGSTYGREFTESKQEIQVASNTTKVQDVVVAANPIQ